jgi:methionyl-tRNA formyltransferase
VRIVVCAYSEVGYACLDELLDLGADVRLVVTHADAPGEKIWFGSVAERAAAAGIPAIAPADVNARETVERIARAEPDLLFSFYYRQMMKADVLALPRRAALNLHGSLLPRYRGRSPVNWVLVNGESETGVTLHEMDLRPDHGAIVAQHRVPISRDDTAQSLTRKLALAGRAALREVLPALLEDRAPRRPQMHSASSYFGGRRPSDGEIDWREPAERVRNLVRAVTDPWPGAFVRFRGAPLVVWAAETGPGRARRVPGELHVDEAGRPWLATGEGDLELLSVCWDGETRSGREWAKRVDLRSGERLAPPERVPRAAATDARAPR